MDLNMTWDKVREVTPHDLRSACIPERKWEVSLDCIPDADYKGHAVRYIETLEQNIKDGVGLLLWGPYRSGKTSIACVIAVAAIKHYVSALFLEAHALMDGWLGKAPGDEQTKRKMMASHLLIIDNLGQEHGKEYTKATVDYVIRHRAERKRATIVTTNLSLSELEKEYGSRFIAIARSCLFPVKVSGKDWGDVEQQSIQKRFER
jgi:DNA replication protein DnaC